MKTNKVYDLEERTYLLQRTVDCCLKNSQKTFQIWKIQNN